MWNWRLGTFSMPREFLMASFQESTIDSCYHLDKGELSLDQNIIKKFPLKEKDMFKV
jgi:hypothetical protein